MLIKGTRKYQSSFIEVSCVELMSFVGAHVYCKMSCTVIIGLRLYVELNVPEPWMCALTGVELSLH